MNFLLKIEGVIRKALENGDVHNDAFRQRIYDQALELLNHRKQKNSNFLQEHKDSLKKRIMKIEAEFVSILKDNQKTLFSEEQKSKKEQFVVEEESVLSVQPGIQERSSSGKNFKNLRSKLHSHQGTFEDQNETGYFSQSTEENTINLSASSNEYPQSSYSHEKIDVEKFRKKIIVLFIYSLLITATVLGSVKLFYSLTPHLYATFSESITLNKEKTSIGRLSQLDRDTNSAPMLSGKSFEENKSGSIIRIFEALPSSAIRLSAGMSVRLMNDNTGTFLRINGSSKPGLVFDIQNSILDKIAGKNVIFNITARAKSGTPTWIAVSCNLNSARSFSRARYLVKDEKADYLFRLSVPLEKKSEQAITLVIDPDFENSQNPVDIYEIYAWIIE